MRLLGFLCILAASFLSGAIWLNGLHPLWWAAVILPVLLAVICLRGRSVSEQAEPPPAQTIDVQTGDMTLDEKEALEANLPK